MRLCIAAVDRPDTEGDWDALSAAASTAIDKLLLMDDGIESLVPAATQTF